MTEHNITNFTYILMIERAQHL